MGTRQVYEEKLRNGNLQHDPTMSPGLGSARCPRCLSLISPNPEKGGWAITSVLHDAASVAGSGAGGLLSAVHSMNSGIPFIQNHVKGPKWLQFSVGELRYGGSRAEDADGVLRKSTPVDEKESCGVSEGREAGAEACSGSKRRSGPGDEKLRKSTLVDEKEARGDTEGREAGRKTARGVKGRSRVRVSLTSVGQKSPKSQSHKTVADVMEQKVTFATVTGLLQ